jgi:para-nitrobenzyl esterase
MNVWLPAKHSAKKLPVMFWIYGGGWVNGGSSPSVYDGSQFAKNGVVLVIFHYRLGRFGFFAHPSLTKENPTEALGNYGYMDQIAALQWVQRNIAAFGGDPGNVTIFGESAGGFSVHMLMTTTLTVGLFERAIVESGGGPSVLSAPSSRDLFVGPCFGRKHRRSLRTQEQRRGRRRSRTRKAARPLSRRHSGQHEHGKHERRHGDLLGSHH